MSSTDSKVIDEKVEVNTVINHKEDASDILDHDLARLNTIEDSKTSHVIWLICICVSVGGFLFGNFPFHVPLPLLVQVSLGTPMTFFCLSASDS